MKLLLKRKGQRHLMQDVALQDVALQDVALTVETVGHCLCTVGVCCILLRSEHHFRDVGSDNWKLKTPDTSFSYAVL